MQHLMVCHFMMVCLLLWQLEVGHQTHSQFEMVCIQWCTIAPTLFILYFGLMIDRWVSRCQVAGMEVQFKMGGKLIGERTRKPSSFVLSEFLFADDAALVCSCRENMVLAARIFDEVATGNGLTLSVPKTKLLVAGIGLMMIWLY